MTGRNRDELPLAAKGRVAAKAFWNRAAASAMRRLVETYRPDVVHLHKLYPQLSAAPVAVAARRGVPLVQTLHDYELISANWTDVRGGWVDRTETRFAYRSLNTGLFPFRRAVHTRSVDAFISVSRLVAQVHEAHGIRSEVIPNFVRAHDPEAPPPAFAGRSGIVYVGRLSEEKGVRDVLELARCLPDVRVSIAGSGPLLGEVRARAAELDNLSALGFTDREDVTALVAGARLAVVPSLWQEPGALAPLEAMSLGTPVIAYSNGGLAEYVADTGGGRVVHPDVGALVSTCSDLLDDEAGWNTLSEKALTGVAEQHSPEAYAERLESVYASVARRKRA